jgi:hypothetical protein
MLRGIVAENEKSIVDGQWSMAEEVYILSQF